MPASLAESRKRERPFHKTKAAALAHAAALREKHRQHGEAATAIRPTLAEAATLAEKILAPWTVSLVEAARLVAAIKEQENASRPLGIALDAWISACEGLRPLAESFPGATRGVHKGSSWLTGTVPRGGQGIGVFNRT